ncbi:MAG: phosphoribosylanthranilate isomerase [Porphyromonadaceae bacterium]|nr:MAG: phosphoribosylanthranilate isomerase [Porphyromonadaceae bacterium]
MIRGQVKICGLKDPGNILEVIQLKPDWIGLIFYPGSLRYISDPKYLEFLNKLPDRPLTVGVFVNPDIKDIRNITEVIRLDAIQLHGSETPELCEELRREGYTLIKAFGIHPGFDFNLTDPYHGKADYFLFDTGSPKLGGTGEQFAWSLLNKYQGETPYFLSGGLSPETQIFPNHRQFAGVDLNSRFETAPGIKHIGLLQKFLKQFRNE